MPCPFFYSRALQLFVDIVQSGKLPTTSCLGKRIDYNLIARLVLTTNRKLFGSFRFSFRFGVDETFRGAAFVIENIAVTPQELRAIPDRPHAVRHPDRKLRHVCNGRFVSFDHCLAKLFPERPDKTHPLC